MLLQSVCRREVNSVVAFKRDPTATRPLMWALLRVHEFKFSKYFDYTVSSGVLRFRLGGTITSPHENSPMLKTPDEPGVFCVLATHSE